MATATETTAQARPQSSARPIQAAIQAMDQLLRTTESSTEYFRRLTHLIASHFDALYGSIEVRSGASHYSEEFRTDQLDMATMMSMIDALILEAQSDERSIARRFEAQGGSGCVAVSTPIHNSGGELAGAFVVVLRSADNETIKKQAMEITNLVGRIDIDWDRHAAETRGVDESTAAMQAIVRVASYSTSEAMGFALVNSLAQKMDCAQVAMGQVVGNRVELLAVSGISEMSVNSPGLVDVRQAMDECFDRGESILVQNRDVAGIANSDGHLLHQHWHRQTAGSPVLSIPIDVDGVINGVISLRRDPQWPFHDAEVEQVKSTLAPFGPAVDLLLKARQTTWQRLKHSFRDMKRSIAQPKTLARRIVALAMLVGLAFFLFGWMPFRLTVPCVIGAAQRRQVSAPFDGMIREVLVRPGDEVTTGQVLARFDTRELMIERQGISAEMNVAQVELNRAIMQGDSSAASVARAELQLFSVRRNAIDEKIRMAEVRASSDGSVIRGDLITEVGAMKPMGTPLMEIAPSDGWIVELKVPDSMATYVAHGRTGEFACVSRPGDRQDILVSRLVPAAEVVDGKSIFMAEAEVKGDAEWMRAGMEGMARIDGGWQPVWWIVLHRFIDPIRMGAW